MVGGHVLKEAAAQAQRLQEGTGPSLQAAFTSRHGAKGLGDAQVLGQDHHGDLWGDTEGEPGGVRTGEGEEKALDALTHWHRPKMGARTLLLAAHPPVDLQIQQCFPPFNH